MSSKTCEIYLQGHPIKKLLQTTVHSWLLLARDDCNTLLDSMDQINDDTVSKTKNTLSEMAQVLLNDSSVTLDQNEETSHAMALALLMTGAAVDEMLSGIKGQSASV